jgi:hypothetical protein
LKLNAAVPCLNLAFVIVTRGARGAVTVYEMDRLVVSPSLEVAMTV